MAVRNDFTAGEVLAAADLNDTFASKLDEAGGKILQIVRNSNGSTTTTTSTAYVDVTGMTVTITPQKADSAIIVIATVLGSAESGTQNVAQFALTDNSNNALSGGQRAQFGQNTSANVFVPVTVIGYSTPATTSATTYKLRFLNQGNSSTTVAYNGLHTGQIYAIEVSA